MYSLAALTSLLLGIRPGCREHVDFSRASLLSQYYRACAVVCLFLTQELNLSATPGKAAAKRKAEKKAKEEDKKPRGPVEDDDDQEEEEEEGAPTADDAWPPCDDEWDEDGDGTGEAEPPAKRRR